MSLGGLAPAPAEHGYDCDCSPCRQARAFLDAPLRPALEAVASVTLAVMFGLAGASVILEVAALPAWYGGARR